MKKEMEATNVKHYQNLLKAQQQAALIANSENVQEVSDLQDVASNDMFYSGSRTKQSDQDKLKDIINTEFERATETTNAEYEGYSGLTEMASHKEDLAEKELNSPASNSDAILAAKQKMKEKLDQAAAAEQKAKEEEEER